MQETERREETARREEPERRKEPERREEPERRAETGEGKHKPFREQSPEEVRRNMKERVRKGIAGFAGALEGMNEEVERDRIPERTERAIHNVGQTTRRITGTAREETRQTREAMKHKKQA